MIALGWCFFNLSWGFASFTSSSKCYLSYFAAALFRDSRQLLFLWFSRRSCRVGRELRMKEQWTGSQELNLCGFLGKRKEESKPSPETVQPDAGLDRWRAQKEGEFSTIRGQQAVTYGPNPACLWFYMPLTLRMFFTFLNSGEENQKNNILWHKKNMWN